MTFSKSCTICFQTEFLRIKLGRVFMEIFKNETLVKDSLEILPECKNKLVDNQIYILSNC